MPHGGKRPGAGRPKGPETVVLSVRVPKKHYKRIRAAVLELVAKMLEPPPGTGDTKARGTRDADR